MSSRAPAFALPFARTVALHCLGWLLAANLVGLWLGVSLLWPTVGDTLAPLTYGRWVPLHLDWQLYGWCALPLVGALLAWTFDVRHPRANRHAGVALGAWSLALVLGGLAWLGGTTSGKLFLDWHGWTRPLLPAAMHVLWALLAAHTWWRWGSLGRAGRLARGAALALLLVVPSVLQWSASREVHPAVNPDSGGATGAALLGSTLGIVTIYLLLPVMLGVAKREAIGDGANVQGGGSSTRSRSRLRQKQGESPPEPDAISRTADENETVSTDPWRVGRTVAGEPSFVTVWRHPAWVLGASWVVFGLIDRGDVSHHAPSQIAALAVLIAWVPLLPYFWSQHAWPEATRAWRWAAAGWWALLVLSGWLTFLPGWSESLKFTHGLVAHAHLAMAGFVTSVNGAILVVLTGRPVRRGVFWLWQGGCVVFVGAMLVLGMGETERAAELFRDEAWVHGTLALRLIGGLAMTAASARWLGDFLRR